MARSKKTRPFSAIAPGVLRRADKQGKRHGAQVVGAWNTVMGEDISRHTQGFALRDDGELVVFVDSAAWANQLALMSNDLLARLNAHLGNKTVSSLRFTVSKRVGERMTWAANAMAAEEYYAPDTTPPLTLDEVEISQAEHVAAVVKDEGLRRAALKVMIKDLEQKKGARSKRSADGGSAASGAVDEAGS